MRAALINLKRIALVVVSLLAAAYVCEDVAVRFRIPKGRDPYAVVSIRRYYAVTQKNGKPEFYFQPPVDQTCVRALFPHLGYSPCWYLKRRSAQRVDM